MRVVLLGGLPTVSWLRSYAMRSPSFLGNLLMERGLRPAAVVGTPLPLRPILGEWWRRNGLGLPLVIARRYVTRRRNGAATSIDAETPPAQGQERPAVHMVSSVGDQRCVSGSRDALSGTMSVSCSSTRISTARVASVEGSNTGR